MPQSFFNSYPLPLTPTYSQNSLCIENFVPISWLTGLGSYDSAYNQWTIMQPPMEDNQAATLHPRDVLFFTGNIADQSCLDGSMVPFFEAGCPQLGRLLANRKPSHAAWMSQLRLPQGSMSIQAMNPSNAMLDVKENNTHVHQKLFTEPDFDETSRPSLPFSPDVSDISPEKEQRDSKEQIHHDECIAYSYDGITSPAEDSNMSYVRITQVEEIGNPKRYRCDQLDKNGTLCERAFRRLEHLKRHKDTHLGRREFRCEICNKPFNRNDNCQDHYWTHVRRPGKKASGNDTLSRLEIEAMIQNPKLIEKLQQKWRKIVGEEQIWQ